MSILSKQVSFPIKYNTINPLSSTFSEIESYLDANGFTDYKNDQWKEVKSFFIKKSLGLPSKGSLIRSFRKKAPNESVSSAINDLFASMENSEYYAHAWKAYVEWLTAGKLSDNYPLFKDEDLFLMINNTNDEECEVLKNRPLSNEMFNSEEELMKLLENVRPTLKYISYRVLRFISNYDSSLYSAEDIEQELQCVIISKLKRYDFINNKPEKMYGWAVSVAKRHILRICEYANMGKRCRAITGNDGTYFREISIDKPRDRDPDSEDSRSLQDTLVLDDNSEIENTIHDVLSFRSFSEKTRKLYNILYEGDDKDFKTWFLNEEPIVYKDIFNKVKEDDMPNALFPWVQRYLGFPKHEILAELHSINKEAVQKFCTERELEHLGVVNDL